MRPMTECRGRQLALFLVLLLALLAATGAAQAAERSWRSTRYGRQGAEIWAEFPRLAVATGAGYRQEYDLEPGLGFGFGMMFGISDNIAFEGRLLQTNHVVGEEEKEWDLDLIQGGARYTFFPGNKLQPFFGLGVAKLTLERDFASDTDDLFERLTGWGYYATAGVDFIWKSSWSLFLRTDYVSGGYSRGFLAGSGGTDEGNLPEVLEGDSFGVTLGIAYRVPMW